MTHDAPYESDHSIQTTLEHLQKECEELGMGAYLGVQQGSMFPPQFVHLHYKPENPTGDVVKVALHLGFYRLNSQTLY